jgi:ribosome-binding factor A
MSARRLLKAAEAIREVVSMAIVAELRDPRVRDVTVTHVEVSPDMRHAKVHVSIMGDEARQKLGLRGLQSAAGFLQSKIAEQIETRYTPRLLFVLDQGVKKSIELARILKEVLPERAAETADVEANSFSASAEESNEYDSSPADNTSTGASQTEEIPDPKRRPR